MRLDQFMEHVGVKPTAVAKKTGLHLTTVIRVRDGDQAPDGKTMLKLNRWAEEAADAVGLGDKERLSWDHLLPDSTHGKTGAAA